MNFKRLREAYTEVKSFLEEECFEDVNSLRSRIVEDLGLLGNDNKKLILKFIRKYNLDRKEFKYRKYFLTENELFGAQSWFYTLLTLPLEIIDLVLILVFNSRKRVTPNMHRDTPGLTFGDLLTWYLAGEFKLRKKNIKSKSG